MHFRKNDTGSTKQLVLFLTLVWLISWPVWIFSGILSRGSEVFYDTRWLVAQVGVFAPSLSALLVSGFMSQELRKNGLRLILLFLVIMGAGTAITVNAPGSVSEFTPLASAVVILLALTSLVFFSPWNRLLLNPATGAAQRRGNAKWILLATFGPPILFIICWMLVSSAGAVRTIETLEKGIPAFAATLVLAFSMNLNFGGSMGEELGWRGFCLPVLLKNYGPVQASLVLGMIVALWHLPIDLTNSNMPGFLAVIFRVIWAVPLTIIFTWLYLNSPANILTALLLHTSVNILPDIGFSHFQSAMQVFTFIMIALAIMAARSPIMSTGKRTCA
jgi:membrane protease YdiL (CAAX protease family)